MWVVQSLVCFSVGGLLGFAGGFIFHAIRWPLSEDAVAIETGVWRKRAHEAESKLRKIKKESE
jgi:hypothetical protein